MIAEDFKDDAIAPVLGIVVHAHGGQKAVTAAGQINPHDAGGMGAHPAGEDFLGQRQRLVVDGKVDLGAPEAGCYLAEIQRGEPNGFRGADALGRRRQEQDHYEPPCCESHCDFLPSFVENSLSDVSRGQEIGAGPGFQLSHLTTTSAARPATWRIFPPDDDLPFLQTGSGMVTTISAAIVF